MNEKVARDILEPYHRFDAWTQRTGVLNGGGLSWVVRIPLNIVFVVVLFLCALVRAAIEWCFGNRGAIGGT